MAAPIALSGLAATLDCGPREHIALVGGGGKTTMLHALGHQLPGHVVLTSTTKMGRDQTGGFPVVLGDDDPVAASASGPVLAWARTAGDKAYGVEPEQCDSWAQHVDYVVVEADGARGHPFKAPGPFEPVVPGTATIVVSVIGADALGRVIADQCHRPLRVAALAACSPYQRLTPERAAKVLLHPRGARRGCPEHAQFVVAITKVDDENYASAESLSTALLSSAPDLLVLKFVSAQT